MKIAHLEASPGWGGQEIRILREAEGMRERGHTILFCVVHGAKLGEEARRAGFLVYELSFQKIAYPVALIRLLLILRRHRVEIMNTHSSLDSWIGGVAGRLLGISIVRTRHLSTPIKPGWNSRWLYGTFADFVVTTCSEILPMVVAQSGKSHRFVRSIPTGVDLRKMDRATKQQELFPGAFTKYVVGTACFMRSWKGIFDFLQAAHLMRNDPRVRWVIIGGGHERVYRERAAELKLDGIVHFTGHLADPIPALQALDVFALLSTAHEGVSQAILQAAYLKKPLIATPIGGLKEVCIHGETGLTVAPFSPDQIVDATRKLIEDPNLCKRLGEQGRQLVLRQFTMTHMLDQMEEVYRGII